MPRRSTSKHTKRTSRRSRRSKRTSRKVSPRKRRTYRAVSSTRPEAKFKIGQSVFFYEHRNFGNFSSYEPLYENTVNVPAMIKNVKWIPESEVPPGGKPYWQYAIQLENGENKSWTHELDLIEKEGASEPNTHVRPLSEPAQMLEKSKQFIGENVVTNDKEPYKLTHIKCLEFDATNNQTEEQATVRICSDGTVVASMDTEAKLSLPPKKRRGMLQPGVIPLPERDPVQYGEDGIPRRPEHTDINIKSDGSADRNGNIVSA